MKYIFSLLFSLLFFNSAQAIIWKNLDINAEVTSERKALVKEKHDIKFEEDDNGTVMLPLNLNSQQTFELKKIELVDIIKNKTTPIPALTEEGKGPAQPIFYQLSQNLLSISFPKNTAIAYSFSLEYVVNEALRVAKQDFLLKYAWAYPRRNGTIKYFSFNLKTPSDWSSLEGVPQGITRENMAIKDQFLTEIHFHANQSVEKGPAEIAALDDIYTCQIESNLAEQITKAYLPDLPTNSISIANMAPLSFRVKGTIEGIVNLQTVGVDTSLSFKLSDEQKTGLSEKNIKYFENRFQTESVRIKASVNKIINAILFGTINTSVKKNTEKGITLHIPNNDSAAPAKNFDITQNENAMTIVAGQLKISLRNIENTSIDTIAIPSNVPEALLSDTDINSIAFSILIKSCTKI